eukprot:3370738-Pleurochrysis_carterae.AAC.1
MSLTIAAMSRRGAPTVVRRRSAARRSLPSSSFTRASPRPAVNEPSPAHASRTNCTSPKPGTADGVPSPSTTCTTPSSSPSRPIAVEMSTAAVAPLGEPHRPYVALASYELARRARPDGRQPPNSFTTALKDS